MLLLLIKRHPPVSDLHWHQHCRTSTLGWAIKLGSSLYSPFFFFSLPDSLSNYIKCLKIHQFAGRSCKKKRQICEPSFAAAAPKIASLQPRCVNISPTPYYLQQKNWLGKLFTACKLELPGWRNQLNIRNIFANSATPCLPREVITAERNPPERTNYISAQTG